MNKKSLVLALALSFAIVLGSSMAVVAKHASEEPTVTRLVMGMASGSGSTIGPDRALYVTEGKTGQVLRVDPKTGLRGLHVLGGRQRGFNVRNQMEVSVVITHFREVDFVALPVRPYCACSSAFQDHRATRFARQPIGVRRLFAIGR